MKRSTGPRLAILWSVWIGAAAMFPSGAARCETGMEVSMSDGPRSVSNIPEFASAEEAKTFLSRCLPLATAANPRYRSKDSSVETQWIMKSFRFDRDPATNRILASMNEAILEYSDNALSAEGAHEAVFWLDDVDVSERRDSPDFTSAGDPAIGIIFNCKSGKCIQSVYMGAKSSKEWSDVYIQDDKSRAAILEAFRALERPAGGADAPAGPKPP
jgi:hypothetical protein